MSYDLNFWKYKKDVYLNNQEVYEKFSEEESVNVDGLENLPIEDIIVDVNKEFADWKIDRDSYENTKGKGIFQIYTTPQYVRFDCYGMQGQDMNRIIDIMDKYECPLYDPQVPKRYDGKETPNA